MLLQPRRFTCFFHFLGPMISLGLHVDPVSPNIEIHLPLGFLKIGWTLVRTYDEENIVSIGYIDGKWQIQKYEDILD